MFQARITVFPDIPSQPDGRGGFAPGSFADLIQHEIHLPGLDPGCTHTLVAATVAEDRGSAELTVVSEPLAVMSLDRTLRVVNGTPPAHVRVTTSEGVVLAESTYPAPLQQGQDVELGGSHYRVTSADWPGRHPETGACEGDIDWQHVVVTAQPRPPTAPTPAL